jgi:hydrophobe/amphiphile efflux-3 (HAE3) family protein
MAGLPLRISGAAVRRPLLTIGIVVALALAGGVLALGLRPSTSIGTFVSTNSPVYRATVADQRHFGSDAVVVLVRAPLTTLLAPSHLATLTRLEACLAGQYVTRSATLRADLPVAAGRHAAYGGPGSPCGALMRTRPARVVYGPGTFLNRAVAAVNGGIADSLAAAKRAGGRAAAAAYRLARARGLSPGQARADATTARQTEDLRALGSLEHAAEGAGLSGVPSISDEAFVRQIVFGAAAGSRTPQPRFAYLFPTGHAALIQVRLRASLSAAQQARAIDLIRAAVRMPRFAAPAGGSIIVTGVPVVLHDLTGQVTGAIGELLAAAVLVMAAALLAVFRRRFRLLPLAVALAATGITFGVLSLIGATLTLASVAVLPILIGLAVDYGVQFQSRVQEAGGLAGPDAAATSPTVIADAIGAAAPAILTAALATAVGFGVLWLSPVPMVRSFGLLLVVGIGVALTCTLTVVPAALAAREARGGRLAAAVRGAAEILGPPLRGAGEIIGAPLRGLAPVIGASLRGAAEIVRLPTDPARTIVAVARHPGRVLAVGFVLAAAGWAVDGSTPVQSDVTRLVPQSMPALRALRTLETTTGVSGEIDVAVQGANVATPATVGWMRRYQSGLLRRFGYSGSRSCARATLCPALSLPDLFSATGGGGSLTQARIDTLLREVPGYFSSAVITPDHREATLAFGIRLMPLARQQRVIEEMRAALHPPPGVSAALTGLPVLAAQAETSLASPSRRLLAVAAGLLAVGLVLLLVLRRPGRAFAPMIPIVLATGWSALVLYGVGIPLNPMSATLGTLVIAISTEFSVLLSERYRQECAAGHPPELALTRTYRSTGAAVLASGVTAIVGFGVLILSDISMLRDFGLVTLVDLTVSLAGVLLVLPAALALGRRGASTPGPERARGLSSRRRRASVA